MNTEQLNKNVFTYKNPDVQNQVIKKIMTSSITSQYFSIIK